MANSVDCSDEELAGLTDTDDAAPPWATDWRAAASSSYSYCSPLIHRHFLAYSLPPWDVFCLTSVPRTVPE